LTQTKDINYPLTYSKDRLLYIYVWGAFNFNGRMHTSLKVVHITLLQIKNNPPLIKLRYVENVKQPLTICIWSSLGEI